VTGAARRCASLACLCLLFLSLGRCTEAKKQVSAAKERRAQANVPRVTATVLSYHVDLLPKKSSFNYLVAIDPEGKARIGDEADQWRLIDIPNRNVTFVNDSTQAYRTVGLATLVAERRKNVSGDLPAGVSRAVVTMTSSPETFRTWQARRITIAAGPYQRSLWISAKSLSPEPLLSLILFSEPLSTPYAAMLRDTSTVYENIRGMPVLDRSQMSWNGQQLMIQRVLESVMSRRVPASWFLVPDGYRNLTAPAVKGSSGNRPAASSPPAGQKTPAAE